MGYIAELHMINDADGENLGMLTLLLESYYFYQALLYPERCNYSPSHHDMIEA